MEHGVEEMPPFNSVQEAPVEDSELADEFARELDIIVGENPEVEPLRLHITNSLDFGPVCRVDFKTPHDLENSVNRIMLWKLPNGQLVSFFGLNIPAPPID